MANMMFCRCRLMAWAMACLKVRLAKMPCAPAWNWHDVAYALEFLLLATPLCSHMMFLSMRIMCIVALVLVAPS